MITNRKALFRLRSAFAAGLCLLASLSTVFGEDAARWYKGNTHAHSFWSDGDEFPEMVADWYKSRGYDFLSLSDHDILMEGERWMPIGREKRQVPSAVLEKCGRRFGDDWLEQRGTADKREVKLKTFAEVRDKLAEPGRFLLVQGEEITDKFDKCAVHLNAFNPAEVIAPQHGASVTDTISRNLRAAAEQAERLRRPILVQVNHPNWDYSITAEELAVVAAARFFEICNAGGAGLNQYGDENHPGLEKLWDIANTIRIAEMKAPPLYGIGADDAHRYHVFSPKLANPGRAWIVVRARQLSPDALIEAISQGDFYVSTGVALRRLEYDANERVLRVAARAEPGVRYTIQFVGTPCGADPKPKPPLNTSPPDKRPRPSAGYYSPEVGKVLARFEGPSAVYRLTGEELYVRAVVNSDKPLENAPAGGVQYRQAWTQPIGWKKHISDAP